MPWRHFGFSGTLHHDNVAIGDIFHITRIYLDDENALAIEILKSVTTYLPPSFETDNAGRTEWLTKSNINTIQVQIRPELAQQMRDAYLAQEKDE